MQFSNQNIQVLKSLNTDTHDLLLKQEDLTYLLNGDISDNSNNGYGYFVQNVLSNEKCINLQGEYKGYIKLDKGQYIIFLKTTTSSQIVLFDSTKCTQVVLLDAECLNFVNYVKGVYKYLEACGSRRIYFTDGLNTFKYFDIDNCPPEKVISNCRDCDEVKAGFDCDLLNITKCVDIPCPVVKEGEGNLPNGVYQLAIAYGTDNLRYTEYYIYPDVIKFHSNNNAFNRFGIDIDFVCHSNINNSFNTYEVVLLANREDRGYVAQRIGYFPIFQTKVEINSLDESRYIPIDLNIINESKSYYQSAKHIASNSESLVFADLKERQVSNLQNQALDIESEWVVMRVPAKKAHKYKSFMRDEVYPFNIKYIFKDGQSTEWFHIPSDSEKFVDPIAFTDAPVNDDHFELLSDNCDPTVKKYWEIYNTAVVTSGGSTPTVCKKYRIKHLDLDNVDRASWIDCCGEQKYFDFQGEQIIVCVLNDITNVFYDPLKFDVDFVSDCNTDCSMETDPNCDEVEVMRGKFAYWESSFKYPNNACLYRQRREMADDYYDEFGLSCQGIRYHKFPDNILTHIHTKAECTDEPFVNILTIEFKNIPYPKDENGNDIPDIVGYEIGVGDRSNNKSIVSKGLIYNMWGESLADCSESLYANYPFNDLNDDVFLGEKRINQHDTLTPGDEDGFNPVPNTYVKKDKFQYISPDVSYVRNDVGTELKIYVEENGTLEGQYTEVDSFPKIVLLSGIAYGLAAAAATLAAVGLASPIESAISTFFQIIDSIRNFTRRVNYAMVYLGIGRYKSYRTDSTPIGNRRRRIDFTQYLLPVRQKAGEYKINNYQRESGLFIDVHTDVANPLTNEVSRIRMTDNDCKTYFGECAEVNGNIPTLASYYTAMKVDKPDQYGYLTDYFVKKITCVNKIKPGQFLNSGIIYGGDIYITKHKMVRKFPFFTNLPIGLPNDSHFDLSPYCNVWYPRYWMDFQDDNDLLKGLTSIAGIGGLIGSFTDSFTYNLEKIGMLSKQTCEETTDDGNCLTDLYNTDFVNDAGLYIANKASGSDLYAFRQNGKFYAYTIGITEYYCESEFIGNYREINEIPESQENRDWIDIAKPRTIEYPELFLYNLQMLFNGINDKNSHFDPRYDCCNKPCNSAKFRAIYSLPNTNELSKSDNWLNFRPLNYTQFSKEDGDLVHIHSIDNYNMLFVFEDAIYATQGQDALLTENNNVVYLGTGDAFSRRLKRLTNDINGLGGSVDPFSFVNTPYGTFWIDRKRKKVFVYTGELRDITGNMQSWFNEYLKDFKLDYDSYSNGVIGIYDPYSDNVYFTDRNKECSWTISYKPKKQAFISFHSFIPDFYIPLYNNFISVKNGLWKHNAEHKYQSYFDKVEPFIVEISQSNNFQPFEFQSIEVYAEFIKNLGYNKKIIEPRFFDKVWVYNEKQSTGIRNIILKNQNNVSQHLIDPENKSYIEASLVTDGTYRLNGFQDMLVQQPSTENECNGMIIKDINTIKDTDSAKKPNGLMRGKKFKIQLINTKYTDKVLVELNNNINKTTYR